MEFTASELAKKFISEKNPVEEVKKVGYPSEIVTVVADKMRKFGL